MAFGGDEQVAHLLEMARDGGSQGILRILDELKPMDAPPKVFDIWAPCLGKEGRFADARQVALAGVARYPDNAALLETLGDICGDVSSYKEAARAYGRAFEIAQKPELLASWTRVLAMNNKTHRVRGRLEAEIEKDPANPPLLSALARVKTESSDYNEAVRLLRDALGYAPKDKAIMLQLCSVYTQAKDFSAANNLADEFEQLYGSKEIRLVRAIQYQAEEKWAESQEILERLLDENPMDTQVELLLVRALRARKRYKDALKILDRHSAFWRAFRRNRYLPS